MTAKRFKFNGMTNCIEYDNKSILLDSNGDKIEELLNELYEEAKDNEHYHSEVLRLYEAVSEKNEQLRIKIRKLRLEKIHQNKENEHLKQRIKELELLNDGLNYALQNIRKIDVEIDVGDV